MILDARAFRALPPLDANGTTAYIQGSSARSGQDRRGGTVAGAFPDTPELLPGKLVTGPAKLGTAMRHHAWSRAGRRGLNPTQGQVLVVLRSAGGQGLRVSELADRLAVATATVSDSVSALARKGLVTKQRDPADARAVAVFLTVTGQAEADEAAGWPDVLLEAVRTLDGDEQAALYRALLKTVRALQVRGRIPVSQMCVTCRFFRPYAHAGAKRPHHCALVDAPLGDAQIRLDCPEHQAAPAEVAERAWATFSARRPLAEELS
jgi:DNA-binding MarR family transcriptional regulator